MTYRQAVVFLEERERFGIRLGLANMKRLCDRLGNPERRLSAFHVAGTNGKGSTARIIATILVKAGYRTGLYTSPHLLDTRERIQVDNRLISRKDFVSLMAEIGPVVTDLSKFLPHSPTYFETLTAAAFLYFSRKNIDYVVVEVGMGGRLDATNLLDPLVSIITPIGLEHRRFLGNTLAEIAGEKAGIIKEGRPVVSARQSQAALRVIKSVAVEKRASLYLADSPSSSSDASISLPGSFQVENTAVARLALKAAGIKISENILRSALKNIYWPGRIQVISQRPLIIFDVSHNPSAIKVLIVNLAEIYPGRRTTFLFGVLKDKDYLPMLRQMGNYGERFFFTRPWSGRARDPVELEKAFRKIYPKKECRVVPDPKDAFKTAKEELERDGLLCVCGSFYLAPILQTF